MAAIWSAKRPKKNIKIVAKNKTIADLLTLKEINEITISIRLKINKIILAGKKIFKGENSIIIRSISIKVFPASLNLTRLLPPWRLLISMGT